MIMLNDELITLKNTSKFFGSVKALEGINLTFKKGEVHCLAGKNGCGKSTLFKIISGVSNWFAWCDLLWFPFQIVAHLRPDACGAFLSFSYDFSQAQYL